MVCFSQAFYDGAAPPPSPLLNLPFWFAGEASPLLPVSAGDVASMDSLWGELAAEAAGSEEDREDMLRLRLRLLLQTAARMVRRIKPESHAVLPRGQALLHQFRAALETHFHEVRSVSAYARMLKSTSGHLSESVLQHTGRTAGELIRERLLLEAQRLLIHSSLNVAEIAVALRFEDPSYFSRFFRRGTEMSPGEFRDQFLKKYPN
jgi:AraC-like DNA-binding protein